MSQSPWWVPLISVVIGAILGYCAAEMREWRRRKREIRGHLEALAIEIQICSEIAAGYLDGKVMAPAYRMPILAHAKSFPVLMSDGLLRSEDISALARFYLNVHAFNLAIDQAQAVLMKKDEDRPPHRLEREVSRSRLKAKKLIKSGAKPTHYDNAMAVMRRHLPADSRSRLSVPEEDLAEEDIAVKSP